MKKIRNAQFHIAFLMVLTLSLLPVSALAETSEAQVSVTVVLASPNGGTVDPELNSMIEDLQKLFTQYSYKKLDQFDLSLQLEEEKTVQIQNGSSLKVEYLGIEKDKINLHLMIKEGGKELINTNFSIAKGGTIIIGGPSHKDGKLVLAIQASIN